MGHHASVPESQRHIIAIGGGLLNEHQAAASLLDYICALTGKLIPKILFVNTATDDRQKPRAMVTAARQLARHPFADSEESLFGRTPDLSKLVLEPDVIFVNGGNTRSMLAVFREWDLHIHLMEAWSRGVILAGSSAGGICWFDYCQTDSWADSFKPLRGLPGYIPGSCCPHYNAEGRREAYHQQLLEGTLPAGYGIDECAAIDFCGGQPYRVLAGKPGAACYRVRAENICIRGWTLRSVIETLLPVTAG